MRKLCIAQSIRRFNICASSARTSKSKSASKVWALIALIMAIASWVPQCRADTTTATSLFDFNGANGADPSAGLIQGIDGYFYGTTVFGGTKDVGTIFKITPSGALTTLHSFVGTDGAQPYGLLLAGDGNFYGVASGGGAAGCGLIFSLSQAGVYSVFYEFSGFDGCNPVGTLVQGADGYLYGTTVGGGTGYGTIFKMGQDGILFQLHSFNYLDGAQPYAGLIQGSDGRFYGVTYTAGQYGVGNVFAITDGGNFAALYSFTYGVDGGKPLAPLIQGYDGNFYGTTYGGTGTAYRITSTGSLSTLFSFQTSAPGIRPSDALVQGYDGNFYGTTSEGGTYDPVGNGSGVIFQLTPGGSMTTLVSFNGVNGKNPHSGLLLAGDGTFYGTAASGGTTGSSSACYYGCGTIFKMSLTGIPPAPIGLSVTAGNGEVSLSWSSSTGATSYSIFEGTSSGTESAAPIATGITGTTTSITGLKNGTKYYFLVRAINSAGASTASSEVSATPRKLYRRN